MDRRLFLKEAILLVGGSAAIAALPGCSWQEAPADLTPAVEARLAKIVDILLPRTATFGGLDVDAPAFVSKVLANWASAETRAAMITLLDKPELVAIEKMDAKRATEAMAAFDSKALETKEKDKEWAKLKLLAMLGYFGSERYQTEIADFKLVPGRYDPCVAVTEKTA